MNSYGVGGVEADTLAARTVCRCLWPAGVAESDASGGSRISALPDPSLYDTYAREQSPCDPITNYAERRGI